MVAAVIAYVAADHNPDDLPVFVFVTVGIFWIFWVKTFVVVQIDRTAFDDDVAATVAHDFLLWVMRFTFLRRVVCCQRKRMPDWARQNNAIQPTVAVQNRSADLSVLFSRR